MPAQAGIQFGRPGQLLSAIGPEGHAREERAERDVLDSRFRGNDGWIANTAKRRADG